MTGTITRTVATDGDLRALAQDIGTEVLEEIRATADGTEPVDVRISVDAEPVDDAEEEPAEYTLPTVNGP